MNDFLSSYHSKLYRFAYALIPDELQAEQLLVDAIEVFLTEQHDFIERIAGRSGRKQIQDRTMVWSYFLQELYRHIFVLSCKRWSQVEGGIKIPRFYSAFYHLTLSDRALLYLYHYGQFELTAIAEIVGSTLELTKKREKQLEQVLYQEIMVDEDQLNFTGVYE